MTALRVHSLHALAYCERLFYLEEVENMRVEALVVYGMCASGRDLAPAQVRDSVVALVRAHWGLGLKALAGAFVTDPTAEDIDGFARFQRASASAEVAARLLEGLL